MGIKQAYLIEIEKETENTRKMIAAIDDKFWDFKPHEKSMSLGNLASHVVELHNWVALALSKNTLDFKTDYKPLVAQGKQDLLDILNNNYQANIDQVNAMSDSDWDTMWTLQSGEHIIVTLPKKAAMRFLIQSHLIHHRGQLSLYLRMSDLPIPGMYGPSADER
ncbi:MAG TPA: DinB family protein [Edaphocola sp.]|nr:DinB family protein [Edaphocola sp.]